MRSASVFLCLSTLFVGNTVQAQAQDWMASAFPERTFDLGTVARGSQLRHTFPILNRTNQDIRIIDTKKKCGCTEVKLGAKEIPPGTKSYVEVVLDTTRFSGFKASGVTLVLDRPVPVELELNLNAFIRDDIQLTPGQVDFGPVFRTQKPTATLTLTYAGSQPDWRVQSMDTISPALAAELTETGRSGSSSQYQLKVTLDPDLPAGVFKDEIVLTTNDPRGAKIPISVSALIQSQVTVSPSTLVLGRLKPGQVVKSTVLVRATKPCKIREIVTRKGDVTAAAAGAEGATQALHTVTLTIKAPNQPGPYTAVVEVLTDIPDEPPTRLNAFGTVAP